MRAALSAQAALAATAGAAASHYDLNRAHTARPRPHLTAPPSEVHEVLNAALRRDGVRTRPCAEHGAGEVVSTLRTLLRRRSPELAVVYAKRGDPRRPRHPSAAGWEAEWAGAAAHPRPDRLRDGRCAEAAEAWVHHLTHEAREELRGDAGFALPLLAAHDAEYARTDAQYAAVATCVTGHNNNGTAPSCTGTYPCWPAEVHWTGTGWGKYPFWGPTPSPDPGHCSKGQGGAIDTYWSQTKKSEKFIHASCDLSTFGTNLSPSYGIACTHLFVGWSAWVYSADEKFCCMSGCGYEGCQGNLLTSPQADFYNQFKLAGVVDNYVGKYYSGKVKNYTIGPDYTNPVPYFWYVTDMDDKPIEQGEGPNVMPRNECNFGPAYIYHQYGNFTATSLESSVFDIPAVCKSTTNYCLFP